MCGLERCGELVPRRPALVLPLCDRAFVKASMPDDSCYLSFCSRVLMTTIINLGLESVVGI